MTCFWRLEEAQHSPWKMRCIITSNPLRQTLKPHYPTLGLDVSCPTRHRPPCLLGDSDARQRQSSSLPSSNVTDPINSKVSMRAEAARACRLAGPGKSLDLGLSTFLFSSSLHFQRNDRGACKFTESDMSQRMLLDAHRSRCYSGGHSPQPSG